jgi:hypothetical protein
MCIAEERAASAFWAGGVAAGVDGIGDLLEMQGLDFFVAGDTVQLRWQKLARGLYVYNSYFALFKKKNSPFAF